MQKFRIFPSWKLEYQHIGIYELIGDSVSQPSASYIDIIFNSGAVGDGKGYLNFRVKENWIVASSLGP